MICPTTSSARREHVAPVRRRYKLLFTLLLDSGLRISEALGLKVQDVRLQDGAAKSVRVIGKGNRERIVPPPEAFGQVLGFWLKDRPRGEFAFAQHPGGPPPTPQTARAYFRRLRQRAHIAKPITPHKLSYSVGRGGRP